jgi:hypothetical protein
MITTKRAKAGSGLNVEFTSTLGFEKVTKLPKLQSQYGGGYGYAGEYVYGYEGDDFGTTTINGVEYTVPDYGMDESWGPKARWPTGALVVRPGQMGAAARWATPHLGMESGKLRLPRLLRDRSVVHQQRIGVASPR